MATNKAIVVTTPSYVAANTEVQPRATQTGEMLVAQPAYVDIVRRNRGWSTMSTSAVAGVVVRPTTTAAFEIYNPSTSGVSLIIDRMFWFNLVSTNVIEGFSGWAQVSTPNRVAAAPTSGSFTVRGNSGNAYSGAVIAAASTTVVDSGWFPWGNAYQKGAGGVVPFGALSVNVEGRLIVQPGGSLSLHVVSSLAGQTFTQGASWFEEPIIHSA
jgi:hypothetical protein